jgi:hypothetical protein
VEYIFEEEGTRRQSGFNLGLVSIAGFVGDAIETCDSINVRYLLTN